MKKIIIGIIVLTILTGCTRYSNGVKVESDSKTTQEDVQAKEKTKKTGLTVDEYEARVGQAIKEMGDKTQLKIISKNVEKDGKISIVLSENIFIFLEKSNSQDIKSMTLAMNPEAYIFEKEDFKFSLLLLVGTADDTLNFKDRYAILGKLGLSDDKNYLKDRLEFYTYNKVGYMYKGSNKDGFFLQAELK